MERLSGWTRTHGADTFVFWPEGGDPAEQVERFAREVVPGVRATVARG